MEQKKHTPGTAFIKNGQHGFTLIEVMLVMLITAIIVAAVFSAYTTQQRTYLAQEQVAEMQQNIRAAVDILSREIRTAGFDPTGNAGATIEIANPGHIQFTKDITDAGGIGDSNGNLDHPSEWLDFGFSDQAGHDVNRDGIPDAGGVLPLSRQTRLPPPAIPSGYQALVENIQAIEFLYLDENDAVTATPAEIRSIRISLLARASRPDPNFENGMTYTSASGANWGPYDDNFRRRLLITTVQCRNMGL
jgi:type IV pilus assembly protein PilW